MTALGKTLTVFVFLLSLVWCWLTVTAFTARTNWQTQANAAKAQTATAIQRAQEIEKAFTDNVAANDAEVKKLNDQINEQKSLNATMAKTNTDLKTSLDNKLKAESEVETKTALDKKNNESTLQQLTLAKARADALEAKLTVAIRSEQDAKNASLQQKLEADSLKARNEQVEQQLQVAQERLRDIQRGGSGLGNAGVVPVRSDIKATVTRVDVDLVTISLGADAGLAAGAVLDVGRTSPIKYLGKIRILRAEPKSAIGVFEPAGGAKAVGDNVPKVGDSVGVFN